MLHLSQDPSKYSVLNGSNMSKIGAVAACDNGIDSDAIYLEIKRAEVVWKVKLNDSTVKATSERGTKKMLLATFDDSCTNKLNHPIKLYAGVTYLQLIQHVMKNYHKLRQLSMSELLNNMSS